MQVSENQKFVSINKECKDEMAMWLVFFYSYNGKTMFLDEKFFLSNTLICILMLLNLKGLQVFMGGSISLVVFPKFGKL